MGECLFHDTMGAEELGTVLGNLGGVLGVEKACSYDC